MECCVGLCVSSPCVRFVPIINDHHYRLSLSLRVAISVKVSMLYPPKGAGVRVLNLPVMEEAVFLTTASSIRTNANLSVMLSKFRLMRLCLDRPLGLIV